MKRSLALIACVLICAAKPSCGEETIDQASGSSDRHPVDLVAKSDEDIVAFVQKHNQDKIGNLVCTIKWARCTAKGFAALSELNQVEDLTLVGDAPGSWVEKNGNFYFKPIGAPDSFAEQVANIKSLKRIFVWYGCLTENHKKLIKKGLPDCEINEHLNKI